MPIYEFECPDRHRFERFFKRHTDAPDELPCFDHDSRCGKPARRIISQLARFNIERTWNDKANDYQGHGPYHQAKSQLENVRREGLERAERDCDRPTGPITEEAIQVGAREIDKQSRRSADGESRVVERQRRQMQKARRGAKRKAVQ